MVLVAISYQDYNNVSYSYSQAKIKSKLIIKYILKKFFYK